jgi:hypothetical protein
LCFLFRWSTDATDDDEPGYGHELIQHAHESGWHESSDESRHGASDESPTHDTAVRAGTAASRSDDDGPEYGPEQYDDARLSVSDVPNADAGAGGAAVSSNDSSAGATRAIDVVTARACADGYSTREHGIVWAVSSC